MGEHRCRDTVLKERTVGIMEWNISKREKSYIDGNELFPRQARIA